MTSSFVKYSGSGGVATIEFSRPPHNSLSGELLNKIVGYLEQASSDDAINIILLKSAGERTFCAGADFDELISIENAVQGKVFFNGFAGVINAIRLNKKLVVCRVQGKAVGGGLGLAAAADICFATTFASVRLSELSIGIGPFVIGPAVQRKMGRARFSTMSLQPTEWLPAGRACDAGLYAKIFDNIHQMDAHLMQYLNRLAAYNPEALAQMKKVFWEGTDHWSELLKGKAEISGKLVLSAFTKKALGKI